MGKWIFRSKIYLGSMEDRSIRVDKEDEKVNSYHPEEYNREYYQSHYQVMIKDGLKLYIIPIMQKNYLNQFTKLLVVTETNLQRSALTDNDQYNEEKYSYLMKKQDIVSQVHGRIMNSMQM